MDDVEALLSVKDSVDSLLSVEDSVEALPASAYVPDSIVEVQPAVEDSIYVEVSKRFFAVKRFLPLNRWRRQAVQTFRSDETGSSCAPAKKKRATRTFHSEEQKFGNELRALQKFLATNACSACNAATALHSEQRASQQCHAKKIRQHQPQAK